MKYLNPYRLLIDTKNFLYQKKMITPYDCHIPVISVGNLTTGGTGKTPIVLETLQLLAASDKTILVISKSYKASLEKPAEVDLANENSSSIFGDEPCLIKKCYSNVYVWSGPHKSETLKAALESYRKRNIKIDVIVVDDGFSHRKIFRNLDIVLIDVSQPESHYKLIPFGHLREDVMHLRRADLIVLTKTNNADAETLTWFRNYLPEIKKPFIEAQFLSNIQTENKNIFLFSGIGNPEQLRRNLEKSNYNIVKHISFADHHAYSEQEQMDLLSVWEKFPDSVICTTEKDFIKITNLKLKQSVKTIQLTVEMNSRDKGFFHEKISQIF